MSNTHWKHEPGQSGACKWFLWRNEECVAWVCTAQNTGNYIVDAWGKPVPTEMYPTLEAAQMAAELIFS
jgi:hypothetical protein